MDTAGETTLFAAPPLLSGLRSVSFLAMNALPPDDCEAHIRPERRARSRSAERLCAEASESAYPAGKPCNAPGRTRTSNLLVRSQPLYPIELRARAEWLTNCCPGTAYVDSHLCCAAPGTGRALLRDSTGPDYMAGAPAVQFSFCGLSAERGLVVFAPRPLSPGASRIGPACCGPHDGGEWVPMSMARCTTPGRDLLSQGVLR